LLFYVVLILVGGYDSLLVPADDVAGCISGVPGAYLLMLPYTRLIVCMFFILPPFCFKLSVAAFLTLFAEQVIYDYMGLGRVACLAHAGGFVMGVLLASRSTECVSRKPSLPENFYRYLNELYGVQII
jgi:membrane associated rhomboid family serine protease